MRNGSHPLRGACWHTAVQAGRPFTTALAVLTPYAATAQARVGELVNTSAARLNKQAALGSVVKKSLQVGGWRAVAVLEGWQYCVPSAPCFLCHSHNAHAPPHSSPWCAAQDAEPPSFAAVAQSSYKAEFCGADKTQPVGRRGVTHSPQAQQAVSGCAGVGRWMGAQQVDGCRWGRAPAERILYVPWVEGPACAQRTHQ